jgi:hypothetical protein
VLVLVIVVKLAIVLSGVLLFDDEGEARTGVGEMIGWSFVLGGAGVIVSNA